MQDELKAQAGRSQQSEEMVKQMQQQVTQQEGVIQMLRMQLEQVANVSNGVGKYFVAEFLRYV